MSRSLDTRLFSFETISMSMHPVWPGNLLRHGLVSLVLAILLIWQLNAPAQARTESQAAPGPGNVLVRGPGESAGPGRPDLPQKRVLLLYSEDKAHPGHELTDQGIRAAFRSNKLFDVQLFSEYLDLSRFGGTGHDSATADYLSRKYAGVKIDAIITIYPAAIDFLMREEGKLLAGVPIVACEITRTNAENLESSPSRRLITGVILGDNIAGILDSAFLLKPGTKHVALVAGVSRSDLASESIFRKALEPYAKRVNLIDLTKLPMQETLSRVGSLPLDTIVLYSTMFTDGAGQSFVPREALTLISRATNAPMFGLYDSYLGYGIVGGRLVSFEQQGKEAATRALRIMAGESPASIPFGGEKAYANLYDWRELKRWGFRESALPADAIILNKPVTAWEMYKFYIIGAVAFILLEATLILFLIVQRRQTKRAVAALRESEAALRSSHKDIQRLAGRLISAQEEELRRLSRELHDDLTQRLAVLAIEAGKLELNLNKIPEAYPGTLQKISQMKNELIKVSEDVHHISRQIHPSILDDLGLVRALESEFAMLMKREKLRVRFIKENVPAVISNEVALCLYRIIQEGLKNIAKHSGTGSADIFLTGDDNTIRVTVKDRGVGFDPLRVRPKPGLGLASMRERALLVNGDFSVESQPGQGTVINVRVPLTGSGV